MAYARSMGLIQWFKELFSKKDIPSEQYETATRLTVLKLGQDLHAQTINDIIDRLKNNEEFKSMVANAFNNIDNRVDSLEKMAGFLYEKTAEQETRVDALEERAVSDDFSKLAAGIKEEE